MKNIKRFFSRKSNRLIALVLAAALVLGSAAVGLAATLAADGPIDFTFDQPNDVSALPITGVDYETQVTNSGTYTARTDDSTQAAMRVDAAGRAWITVRAGAVPGVVAVGLSTKSQITNARSYQLYTQNGIEKVTIANGGKLHIPNKGDATKSVRSVVTTTPAGKENDIEWSLPYASDVLTSVAANGNVIPKDNGTALVLGKVTDKWGVERVIPVIVQVGPQVKVITVGNVHYVQTDKDDNGAPVYVEVDDNGKVKVPTRYWKNIDPGPRQEVWVDEDGNWVDEKPTTEEPLGDGVKEVGGRYWKKVPGTDNGGKAVWQEVTRGGNPLVPEYYVGGTGSDPDIYEHLYKINPPHDTLYTDPSAENFDDTYPGWLKYGKSTPNRPSGLSEYDEWRVAVADKGGNGPLGDGVVKAGDRYWKIVPGTENPGDNKAVWQEVNRAGDVLQPENYVGGTMTTPDPYNRLYRIRYPQDTTGSPVSAEDYDDTYPRWLMYTTNGRPSGLSEYDEWRVAVANATIGTPASISGPSSISLNSGYAATSAGAYTVGGSGTVTVTLSDNLSGKLSWNNSTKRIDIAAGLAVGTYDVTLTASNGVGTPDSCNLRITVGKINPTGVVWPSGLTAKTGQTLTQVAITGGSSDQAGTFSWVAPSTSTGTTAGTRQFEMKFTPNDGNYATVTSLVNVVVSLAVVLPPTEGGQGGIPGIVIDTSKTGDDCNWLAIATKKVDGKDYLLILRAKTLPARSYTTAGYVDGAAKTAMTTWYNQTAPTKLKGYTVQTDADSKLGTWASLDAANGFSSPTPGSGSVYAFLLSFQETANFCSYGYWKTTGSVYPSSPSPAPGNLAKMLPTGEAAGDANSVACWLRSPSIHGNTAPNVAATLNNVDIINSPPSIASGIAACPATTAMYVQPIRPALWVSADILNG